MIKQLQNNIRWKLVLSFTLVLIGVMVVSSFIVNYFSTRFIKEQIIEYNTQLLSKAVYDFDSLLTKVSQFAASSSSQYIDPELWQGRSQVLTFDDLKRQVDFEKQVKDSITINNLYNTVLGMGVYYNDEQCLFVGEGVYDPTYQLSQSIWYQEFLESGANYYFYGPMIEEYKPVNTKRNEILLYIRRIPVQTAIKSDQPPILFLAIRYQEVEAILEQLNSDNRLIFLTDEDGEILYMNWESEADFDISSFQSRIKESGNEEFSTYSDGDMFITNMYIDNYHWILSVVDDNRELFKGANALTRNINLVIAICGVSGSLIAVYLSRRLMMPIQVLNSFMSTIEEEPETFIHVKGKDEIAQIGTRMNHMKIRLQEMNSKVFLSQVREKEAQLSALQAQINPHFLYNTLDNIYCIAQIEEITAIAHLTKSLSDMLRYSIDFQDPYVTLDQELDHVRAYVSIINERYENGIHLTIDMEEPLGQMVVLKMILQPVVENAWKHGILPKDNHCGHVMIRIAGKSDRCLEIQVSDDGVGMDEEHVSRLNQKLKGIQRKRMDEVEQDPQKAGFGIALTNVNDRIKLKNGDEYGISIKSKLKFGTVITINQQITYKR